MGLLAPTPLKPDADRAWADLRSTGYTSQYTEGIEMRGLVALWGWSLQPFGRMTSNMSESSAKRKALYLKRWSHQVITFLVTVEQSSDGDYYLIRTPHNDKIIERLSEEVYLSVCQNGTLQFVDRDKRRIR